MEFSFDRSKESMRGPDERPQTASGPRPGPDLNTVDPSTIANDRLRKAIERNRAKQSGREAQRPAASAAPVSEPQPQQQQGSFFSQSAHLSQEDQAHIAQQEALREAHREANRQAMLQKEAQKQAEYAQYAQNAQRAAEAEPAQETPRPRARENVRPTSTSVVSRRSVAKPEDTEFVPVKRPTTRKVASQISYTTSSSRKKPKSLDPKYVNWLVKGSWIFCGIMVLRLIFATGGVTDFYSQKTSVSERIGELNDIKKENMQLVREIERMRSDSGFQKKLVRDNLGFIAADEFLVLFPKD